MKKYYEELDLDVVRLDSEDVITSSSCPVDCGDVKDKCPEEEEFCAEAISACPCEQK